MTHDGNGISESAETDRLLSFLRRWFGSSAGIAVRSIEDVRPLFAEEELYISSAVLSRQREFSSGRWCARQALLQLGISPVSILVGEHREPLWPPGIIGSISHGTCLSAAVVARLGKWHGIGIDILEVEAAKNLLRDADSLISSEQEEEDARRVVQAGVYERALLFSAKESVIKSISSSLQRFVDFREISVLLRGDRFEASCEGLRGVVRGRWSASEDLIITSAVLVLQFNQYQSEI
jgi:4'-phosphopantetheinyl transferase EntD